MKVLKQLLFTAAIVIGISTAASAQQDNGKKTPPKPSPPVIVVPIKNPKDDKPKEDKPKNDDKRKKPDAIIFDFGDE